MINKLIKCTKCKLVNIYKSNIFTSFSFLDYVVIFLKALSTKISHQYININYNYF